MKEKEKQMKKVCGFYASDLHFTTMILPYICNEIKKDNRIITILQKDMKQNIEEVLSKMNLNQKLQQKILEINWQENCITKYSKIKKELQKINGQIDNVTILVNGDKEFINIANESIEKIVKTISISNPITMINCYDMTQFNNVSEITDQHEYMINTSGIRKIEEVFTKEEKNA